MSQPASPMEIYKLLNKSNCRHCNEKTCMAFAAAVFTGKRSLSECPYVDAEAVAAFENQNNAAQQSNDNGAEVDDAVEELREQVRQTDLEEAARRLDARFEKGRIIVKVMGKDFAVDGDGRISTQIHVNPWVTVPVFDYIVNAKGTPPTGQWVPLRELKGGREREGLFDQRCTKPLKSIADNYTDFFNDMLDVFDGKRTETRFDADTAVVMVSYGASVYVERQLEQSSQRLNQLQRGEQQLTTANEVLKSHMAKQADSPAVELTPPTPNHVIFLRPAHQRSQSGGAASASPRLALPSYSRPLGY